MSVSTIAPGTAADAPEAEGGKKGGRKKLVLVLVALLVVGGAAWFFLKPAGPPPEPVAGEVLTLDPIQLNLEGGHYLRLGMALQFTADVHEGADGSKALDAAIDLFSGREMTEINTGKQRQELKKDLLHHLEEVYHHEVMDVYFTEFVTQ
ncbi:flagellar basal body-associated protein FliL [uncultured Nocardioides sp.]|uniref:Flagellar protein FliL n=1 Tax=uncultured Nocardioides sp. TaxID=198441 RepID=A0A6J4NYM8_9ACTN|nr:flagellar basal body-associated FliL family protein [uncultured Nocardioides sp.]CAA9401223.1 MAG: Flagellar basal body-associated protein FliL [uncultured Nocardioides sp.]